MTDDVKMTDVGQEGCEPKRPRVDDSPETEGGDASASGVGHMPSDAPVPEEPLAGEPRPEELQVAVPEEPLPGEPRRTQSRWNEWRNRPEVADKYSCEDGERIFEFSDSFSRTGWKPYDKSAQQELRGIFRGCTSGSHESTFMVEVNCFGWKYWVTFDVFRENRGDFANAPDDAIGYQLSNHAISINTKRCIRLTTYRVADRT